MAEENNSSPQEHGEQKEEKKKPIGTLESVVGELGDLFNLGIGVAAPAAGYLLTGNAGVPVVSAAFVAASEGSLTSKKIRDESLGGAIWGTMLDYITAPLKYMSSLGKTAYIATLPFISNSVYPTIDHLVKNKSPKGLSERFNNYWTNVKKTFKTIWPLNLLAALFFTQSAYIVGTIGIANYLFRKFVVKGKEDEHTDNTSYYSAASNVVGKLVKNPIKGLYGAVGAIGNSVADLYKSSPKPASAASTPATEPATQHP